MARGLVWNFPLALLQVGWVCKDHIFGGWRPAGLIQGRIMSDVLYDDYLSHFENLKRTKNDDGVFRCVSDGERAMCAF